MLRHTHASDGSTRITLGAIMAALIAIAYSPAAHALILPPAVGSGTLVLHLDANAINGIGNPNPANGAFVSTWTDLSGNGYDATQATSALQPIFLTNQTPNDSPAVNFNGSSQYLLTNATVSGPTTWFIIYNTQGGPASGTSGAPITLRSSDALTFDSVSILNGVSPYPSITLVADGAVGHGVGINPGLDSSNHLLAFGYDGVSSGAAGSYQISYDQTPDTVSATAADSIGFAHAQGAIGQRDNDITFFGGNISAILVYSDELNPTDYHAIQSYLNSEFLIAPEPASLGLIVVGGVTLLRRRRA